MLKKTLESIILSASLLTSCSVIDKITENGEMSKLREEGYNPTHAQSCGPRAISELLAKYNIDITNKEVSKEIISSSIGGNIVRSMLGIFSRQAMEITMPYEIIDSLNAHLDKSEYKITEVKGRGNDLIRYVEKIKPQDKEVIAFLRDKRDPLDYHWTSDKYSAVHRYGLDNTLVKKIYVIEKLPIPK